MEKLKTIVVCGNGLAANLTALALQEHIATDTQITLVKTADQVDTDIFYGSTTAPDIYPFHLTLNVTEPDVLLNTNTAFSFGSYFNQWGGSSRSWMQCFHLPFAVEKGVSMHHFVARQRNGDLQPFLINAQAALQNKFAHPPEDSQYPLSRVEFGYQFCPRELSQFYASRLDPTRVNIVSGELAQIQIDGGRIASIKLAEGGNIQADLFIDCTGPEGRLLSALGVEPPSQRQLKAISGHKEAPLGPAYRNIKGRAFGWQADTTLKNGIERLTVYAPSADESALEAHQLHVSNSCSVYVGHRPQAWKGNCVAMGQAANVIEPLTPAPIKMLVHDLQRLLELLPISNGMASEEQEYNRRFTLDAEHVALFHQALFELEPLPDSQYWREAKSGSESTKLQRKLNQFIHRGILANFDLEPFNEEDWVIQHLGMGRVPKAYDSLADQISVAEMNQKLDLMQNIIKQVVAKMPPHAVYMEKLLQYLKQKQQ